MDEWSETLRALPKATDLRPWCEDLLVIELCFVFQVILIRCETPNREKWRRAHKATGQKLE